VLKGIGPLFPKYTIIVIGMSKVQNNNRWGSLRFCILHFAPLYMYKFYLLVRQPFAVLVLETKNLGDYKPEGDTPSFGLQYSWGV